MTMAPVFASLSHVDDHRIAAEAQHEPRALCLEVHDDAVSVLQPQVAAAQAADGKPVSPLRIGVNGYELPLNESTPFPVMPLPIYAAWTALSWTVPSGALPSAEAA